MCENLEQNKGRVVDWECIQWDIPKRHVRRLQERIFRVTRDISYRDVRGDLDCFGEIVRCMIQRNTATCTGSWGASPVQGNLHAGFLKEEEDGNILSLFNEFKRIQIK